MDGKIAGYRRFRVLGRSEATPRDIERAIRAHALVELNPEKSMDETAQGWCSPLHISDTDLTADKFHLDDSLALGLRTDTLRVPPAMLNAAVRRQQAEIETKEGPLSPSRIRELRDLVKARLRQQLPIVRDMKLMAWRMGEPRLLLGTRSAKSEEAFITLFANTFRLALDIDGPSAYAQDLRLDLKPEPQLHAGFYGSRPDILRGTEAPTGSGFLGIEFLIWLLYRAAALPDGQRLKFPGNDTIQEFEIAVGTKALLASSIDQDEIAISSGLGKSLAYSPDVCYAIAGGRSVRELELLFFRGTKTYVASVNAMGLDCKAIVLPSLIDEDSDDAEQTVAERVALWQELDDMIRASFLRFLDFRREPRWSIDAVPAIAAWLQNTTRGGDLV